MALLTEKRCLTILEKALVSYIAKNNLDEGSIGYYGDIDTEAFHSWRMYVPSTDKSVTIAVDKSSKAVSIDESNGDKWAR